MYAVQQYARGRCRGSIDGYSGGMASGRPRATSRDVIAEAACELFLEQGFEATSVSDITTRAGVSRSSFFNYFAAKSDVLWAGLDERIAALTARLARDAEASVPAALRALADGFAPDSLALAIVNADAMGLVDELEREAAVRQARIAAAVAARLRSGGVDPIAAQVAGAAHAGAVMAAIDAWARAGAGRAPLGAAVDEALAAAAPTLPAPAWTVVTGGRW